MTHVLFLVLAMVAVGGFTLTVCLVVLCVGIVCLRRQAFKQLRVFIVHQLVSLQVALFLQSCNKEHRRRLFEGASTGARPPKQKSGNAHAFISFYHIPPIWGYPCNIFGKSTPVTRSTYRNFKQAINSVTLRVSYRDSLLYLNLTLCQHCENQGSYKWSSFPSFYVIHRT